MTQPGSLRDSSLSFVNTAATSASCATFAIQVTARTTIRRLFLVDAFPFYRREKIFNQYGLVAIRARGDHSDPCPCFLFNEA